MKRLQVWYIAVDQNPKYDYWKICLEDESRRRSWSLKWSGRGGQSVWSSGVLRGGGEEKAEDPLGKRRV